MEWSFGVSWPTILFELVKLDIFAVPFIDIVSGVEFWMKLFDCTWFDLLGVLSGKVEFDFCYNNKKDVN